MDFPCPHCGQTLRVPDGSEGRTAKCPACGGLSTVPGGPPRASAAEDLGGQTGDLGGQAGSSGSGFVPDPAAGPSTFSPAAGPSTFAPAAGPSTFPTAAGYTPYDPQRERRAALDRVAGPATGIIVCAILNIILWIAVVAFYSVMAFVAPMQADIGGDPNEARFLMIGMIAIYGTMGLVAIVVNIVSIVGAMGMKKLRSRGFAMAAAILQMIPCFSSCWPLGLGMGIWAIIVLSDPAVRRWFH